VCKDNRIVHEWLVRDQAAIARQIGRHERDVAQDWLDQRGAWHKSAMPPAPGGYVSFVDTQEPAVAYADSLRELWTAAEARSLTRTHDVNAIAALPGGVAAVGLPAIQEFWRGMTGALTDARFQVEHLVANQRPGRSTALAIRWRVQASHSAAGRYGQATNRPVEVMGISHAEIEAGLVVREWHLIDDVAIWMQLLNPRT
jgi:predicted ester cyclase